MTMTTHVSPPAQVEEVSIYQSIGLARLVDCGYCHVRPWEPCLTGRNGAVGDHLARFARAERRGLMGAADLDVVLAAVGDGMVSGATVIHDGPALERPRAGQVLPGMRHARSGSMISHESRRRLIRTSVTAGFLERVWYPGGRYRTRPRGPGPAALYPIPHPSHLSLPCD